jgi:hypothetical protein
MEYRILWNDESAEDLAVEPVRCPFCGASVEEE